MKKESTMQKLFAYAGSYKYLTMASWILSAASALIALLPFYYIWRIMQEVVLAAPDYSKAQNLSGLGWSAVGFALLSMLIYICALLCSPHCSLPRAGEYAKHPDASYPDVAHGIHGQ